MLTPPFITTIFGTGAWGQTLRKLIEHNGHTTQLLGRPLPDDVTTQLQGSPIWIVAVSMVGVRPTRDFLLREGAAPPRVLVSATKGLDAETEATPFEIWRDAFPEASLVVLSGPNLASEIQQGLPAAAVASSYDEAAVGQVQDLFASEQFRVYGNDDPIGTELGGILKNIMAIAAGICDGLELGANAKAALITRALPEMMRFGMYRGAQAETFWGLSGLGDVLTSCHSPRSRNYQVGFRLGQGESLSQVLATLEGTAEGVNTVRVVVRHAQRHGLSVPIAEAVASVLEGEVAPQTAVTQLMRRALRSEFGRSA